MRARRLAGLDRLSIADRFRDVLISAVRLPGFCQRHTAINKRFGRQVDTGAFSDAVASTVATTQVFQVAARATHKRRLLSSSCRMLGVDHRLTVSRLRGVLSFVILELSDIHDAWEMYNHHALSLSLASLPSCTVTRRRVWCAVHCPDTGWRAMKGYV